MSVTVLGSGIFAELGNLSSNGGRYAVARSLHRNVFRRYINCLGLFKDNNLQIPVRASGRLAIALFIDHDGLSCAFQARLQMKRVGIRISHPYGNSRGRVLGCAGGQGK